MPRVSIDLSADELTFLRDMAALEGYHDAEDYLDELFSQFLAEEHCRFNYGGPRCWIENETELGDDDLFERISEELYLDPGGGVRHEDEISPRGSDMDDGFPF
ncbi:hypothetical protein ACXYMP_05715 [Aliiroseovarius sp. CAU 1755]